MDASEKALETLREDLGSVYEEIRYAAAHKCHALGLEAFPYLLRLTYDASPMRRAMACNIIRDLHEQGRINLSDRPASHFFPPEPYTAAIDRMVVLASSDPHRSVRQAAVLVLGRWQLEEAMPVICGTASDRSALVREGAAVALGYFTDDYWNSFPNDAQHELVQTTLLVLILDKDEDVREEAISGIRSGGYWVPPVRDALLRALDDVDTHVRGEAAWALARKEGKQFKDRLKTQLVNDPNPSHYYFHAAVEFGDPDLLPEIRVCIEHWRQTTPRGEQRFYSSYAERAVAILEGRMIVDDYFAG